MSSGGVAQRPVYVVVKGRLESFRVVMADRIVAEESQRVVGSHGRGESSRVVETLTSERFRHESFQERRSFSRWCLIAFFREPPHVGKLKHLARNMTPKEFCYSISCDPTKICMRDVVQEQI